MRQPWIDFRELRERLPFPDLLEHYGVKGSLKGDQFHAFCPLPNHRGSHNSASFSANVSRNIFQCFGCRAAGNALDFACLMEGRDPENPQDVRAVAVLLAERFNLAAAPPRESKAPEREAPPPPAAPANLPLDFELKGLDPAHPYLRDRGFDKETIRRFGLGFCGRGYLKGRIAIPLHDEHDRLVGYAGRLVDDKLISPEEPKYRFPTKRERNGQTSDFRKLELLYNANRIEAPVDNLILVEGFPAVWWLHQHGFRNCVALMGAVLSRRHEAIVAALLSPTGTVWLLPDGNDAGNRCAETALAALSRNHRVRWARLADDRQPTDLSGDELRSLLSADVRPIAETSLKRRLERGEITREEALLELGLSFPALDFLRPTEAWEPETLDSKATYLSKGERCALQFLLHVWNRHATWECGRFDAFEALSLWDGRHRAAFLAWAREPWHL